MEKQYKIIQSYYHRLQEELEYLKTTRRAEVTKKIAEARELGDLAENEAYDAAKEEQRDMEARIEELEEILRSAVIVDEFTCDGGVLLKDNCPDKDVAIPESVGEIGDYAFSSCENLTSVTIPEGVTRIEAWAFSRCRGLTSVTIPKGVVEIGARAFEFCENLTSVTIPESVAKIDRNAFAGCKSLTEIHLDTGNPSYSVIDGLLVNRDGIVLAGKIG